MDTGGGPDADSNSEAPALLSGDSLAAPVLSWEVKWKSYTGSLPKAVVLTPDGTEAWITNFGFKEGDNVYVYDAATGKKLASIDLPGRAVEIAFSNDGRTAYISDFDNGKLHAINVKTRTLKASATVGANPKIVTMSPDGKNIYVSNWSSDDISVVDVKSFRETKRMKAGNSPRGSDTNSEGDRLYIANFNNFNMTVVDLVTGKTSVTIPLMRMPRHVKVTPDDTKVLVTCMGDGADRMAIIDPAEGMVDKWVTVGKGPKTIAVTPDSKYAFTADYTGHSVTMVDLEEGKAVAAIPGLGKSPCGMDISADGQTLFVTSWFTRELRAISLDIGSGIDKNDAPSLVEDGAGPVSTLDKESASH